MGVFVIFAGAVLTFSCGKAPSYLNFISRSKEYHNDVADACESLFSARTIGKTMNGNDHSLPSILRELHASHIGVVTNGVFIQIGIGRGAYEISWAVSDNDPLLWELETCAENMRRIHVARRKWQMISPSIK